MSTQNSTSEDHITFNYKFHFYTTQKQFDVTFDKNTMSMIKEPKKNPPEWAKLDCNKCDNCPLSSDEHEYCPVALNLEEIVEFFGTDLPKDDVAITVCTPERDYTKTVSLQSASSSMVGMHMVTSGCPIMNRLRPMARYHLPFANTDETVYRSVGTYLISQYFENLSGGIPDWDLKDLSTTYQDIETVNACFHQRLISIGKSAPSAAAILTLDCFAYYMNLSLNGQHFYYIENLFKEPTAITQSSLLTEDNSVATSTSKINYRFILEDKSEKSFAVNFDNNTLLHVDELSKEPAEWTKLECNKCPNCPLDSKEHTHCPAALSIERLIDFFKDTLSIQTASIKIDSPNRTFSKNAPLPTGISSLMGLLMVTSGCPVIGKLRPMVHSHLPFSTVEETTYRILSMYLLKQYFNQKNDKPTDWDLKELPAIFDDINTVNKTFIKRLHEQNIEDASLNAIVKLDCFASSFKFSLESNFIENLKTLFDTQKS